MRAADAGRPPLPAFPGAEGAGASATGGRGGKVVHVTNLHASGPGSFADAVSEPNRIVVFDVSGIIDLARAHKGGKIQVDQPNITIAGQSAPGEGICLRGGALEVSASNVIVRYIRSRRGVVMPGDTGDAMGAKPEAKGERTAPAGQSQEAFDKIADKKKERGRYVHAFDDLERVVFDHCSASWATDENLSVTHADHSTVSYCIAAEGLDYVNSRQTPPQHSEGGLWGTGADSGVASMHHVLFAHNRLRNPRTTAGGATTPILTLYNSVVYDWSEFPTHTGSERVRLNWIGNDYKPGPSTPADIREIGFEFEGDPGSRVYPLGNVMVGSPAATKDNRRAVSYGRKLSDLSPAAEAAMINRVPFGELPKHLESAEAAYAAVLDDAGATLPARDAVDLQIVTDVRNGTGRVIQKETDLPAGQRWPDYRTLPPLPDWDRDGIPDFWAVQFGLDPKHSGASAISPSGYANIEHYLNNTDPRAARIESGTGAPIVFVSATVSRCRPGAGPLGEWRFTRTGSVAAPLEVHYTVAGDAVAGRDFTPLTGTVTFPAGGRSVTVPLAPLPAAAADRTVVLTLASPSSGYFVGCPSRSLVVIRRGR